MSTVARSSVGGLLEREGFVMVLSETELWRLVGDGLALCLRGASGYAARLTPDAALVLSGEAVADLNYALIGPGNEPEARLRDFSEAVRSHQLPIVVLLAAGVAQQLAPNAHDAGFRHVGSMPLMTHDRPLAPAASGAYTVERVTDAGMLREANSVAARAFGLPEDATQRAFGPPLLASPGAEVFLARQGSTPVSSVQTTRFGPTVGIWTMGTPPEHQRKGPVARCSSTSYGAIETTARTSSSCVQPRPVTHSTTASASALYPSVPSGSPGIRRKYPDRRATHQPSPSARWPVPSPAEPVHCSAP